MMNGKGSRLIAVQCGYLTSLYLLRTTAHNYVSAVQPSFLTMLMSPRESDQRLLEIISKSLNPEGQVGPQLADEARRDLP